MWRNLIAAEFVLNEPGWEWTVYLVTPLCHVKMSQTSIMCVKSLLQPFRGCLISLCISALRGLCFLVNVNCREIKFVSYLKYWNISFPWSFFINTDVWIQEILIEFTLLTTVTRCTLRISFGDLLFIFFMTLSAFAALSGWSFTSSHRGDSYANLKKKSMKQVQSIRIIRNTCTCCFIYAFK